MPLIRPCKNEFARGDRRRSRRGMIRMEKNWNVLPNYRRGELCAEFIRGWRRPTCARMPFNVPGKPGSTMWAVRCPPIVLTVDTGLEIECSGMIGVGRVNTCLKDLMGSKDLSSNCVNVPASRPSRLSNCWNVLFIGPNLANNY